MLRIGNGFTGNQMLTIGKGISISSPNNYTDYNFYLNSSFADIVSTQPMVTALDSGRVDYSGNTYGANEPVIDGGKLLTGGSFTNLIIRSEDTSNWTGSGPWTQSVNITSTGTYTVSTDLNGATVTVTAGTATIDAGASATYGSPDQFVVSGTGTVTISTDTADPKAQLTKSTYKLPYVKTTTDTITVPLNYSDDDEGYKWPIGSVLPDIDSDYWQEVDGVELVTNGDFETNITGWSGYTSTTTAEHETTITDLSSAGAMKCINVDGGNQWFARTSDDLTLKAGSIYKMVGRVYIPTGYSGGGAPYITEAGTFTGSSEVISKASISLLDQWQTVTTIITVGSDIYGRVYLRSTSNADAGSILYWDNITVKQIEPSTAWQNCASNLQDSLDGEPDGTELIGNGDFSTGDFTGWSNNDGCTINGSNQVVFDTALNANPRLMQNAGVSTGDYLYLTYDIISTTQVSGNFVLYSGGFTTGSVTIPSTVGPQIFRVQATATGDLYFRLVGASSGTIVADNFSMQVVDDAQGEIHVDWTPKFDADEMTDNNQSILDLNETGAGDGFIMHGNSGNILLYDTGVPNYTFTSIGYVANTNYLIKAIYGHKADDTLSADIDRTFAINSGSPTINGDVIDFIDEESSVVDTSYWVLGYTYTVNATVSNYSGSGDITLPFDGGATQAITVGAVVSANGTYEYDYTPSVTTYVKIASEAGHTATVTINSIKRVNQPKMQLIVEDKSGATGPWESSVVDFDGSFLTDPNADNNLSLAWENEYFQEFGSIKIYKEPQSW